ncbi:MAG: peptidylprolyl isomerase [Eubacteriales bacterium]|nr:peptidylprolyl isomerase [Eubacteriales bacterium]MDD4323787.1 peptidylprolyl isomerase [Eubacteriales bacterium]
MAKKTNEQSEWKAEVERAERKQRLANLKDSEGRKKKINSRSIGGRIAAIAIVVVLLLVAAVWAVARFGLLQKNLTAITITNSELPGAKMNMSPADLNVEFGNLTMQAQLGYAFSDEVQDVLGRPSADPERTVRDDLTDLLMQQISSTYAMVLAMNNDDSFVLSEERQAELDETIENFEKDLARGAQEQGVGVGVLLSNYFGPGVTSSQYMKFVRQSMLLQDYNQHLADTTEVTAAEREEYKEENAADLKIYNYSYYKFNLPEPEDEEELTDAEYDAAMLELAETANAALELYRSGEMSFAEAMAEYETDESIRENLLENPEDATLTLQGDRLSSTYKDWLTDEEREAEDSTVVEAPSAVIALVFHSADFEDYNVYNVRHILIDSSSVDLAAGETATDEQIEARAEEILAEFEAGAKTEEAFADLAEEYSTDMGSAENGGLYENITYGTMVAPFQDWCLDESREVGDTGIVKSTHGYHIMYFAGLGEEKSIDARVNILAKSDKINDWAQRLVEGAEIERHNLGMGFVGRKSFFQALFAGDVDAVETETSAETTAATAAGN